MQVSCEQEAFVPTHDFVSGRASPALQAGRAAVRSLLVTMIEALIDCLDSIDGDPDFEDGADDEPSLGSLEESVRLITELDWMAAYRGFSIVDGEPNGPCRESLPRSVAVSDAIDQSRWGLSDCSDREGGDDNGIADQGALHEQMGRRSACVVRRK